MAKRDLDLERK